MNPVLDFYILKMLNLLGRHKRSDLITAFFDEKNLLFGIHAVVTKLFDIKPLKTNELIGGKSTKEVLDIVQQKLEEIAKNESRESMGRDKTSPPNTSSRGP